MKLILGIDPGKSGAISFLDAESCKLVSVHDIPRTDSELAKLITVQLLMDGIRFAVVEHVGVMTGKEGVVGMFNFGCSFGVIKGILATLDIPVFLVKPSVWKAVYGLSSNKDLSRTLATQKFPSHVDFFKRKKDDGRAESALLALFGMEHFK